jgi:hypothetical protein
MNKVAIIKSMAEWMGEKGKFYSMNEYQRAKDVPANFWMLRKQFGSWSRIQLLIRTNHPELFSKMNKGISTKVTPVVEKKTAKPAKKAAVKKDTK